MRLDREPDLLTWPRWLGRGAVLGVVVGVGAAMVGLGQRHSGGELSMGGVAGIGGVFAVGGFAVGLWEQIRPFGNYIWRHTLWSSWWMWSIELVAFGGLGYLVGTISAG